MTTPVEDGALPNSTAARDKAFFLHPTTDLQEHRDAGPMVIARGDGIRVYDEEGNAYIEGLAGLWCVALGFSEERLVRAATEAMRRLPYYHSFFNKTHTGGVELAERLIGMAPAGMAKVFFANSGSEALDTAMKIVWYYNNARGRPRKKKIIAREKAFHGVNIASGSLTGLPVFHEGFDLPIANVIRTGCPHFYRYGRSGESEEAFADRLADSLEKLILAEGPDTVAAFVAEPVMGSAGVIVPPAGYFPKIQAVLRKYDVLAISDEVICGFGRTGNMWGCQTFEFEPDIVTSAKALSSAYLPISAVMVSQRIYEALVEESGRHGLFGHGYTYSAHPVCAAVALETLKIYEERDIVAQVRALAPRFQEGFRGLADHPLVGEARGVGLMGGVELVRDKASRETFPREAGVTRHVGKRAEANGLIVRALADSVNLAPPLIATESDIDDMLTRLRAALDETWTWVRAEGLAA
jgi:4-aminobutyrate---pyruvate transaminase